MNETQEPKYRIGWADDDKELAHLGLVNRASGEVIPADEPIFIFRARDVRAHNALQDYADSCADNQHRAIVQDRVDQFGEWAVQHPDRMKEPDSP